MTTLVRLRAAHPVAVRAGTLLVMVGAALVGTYYASLLTNFNVAGGAAMAIVLLGLSFLTGASGQISIGNGAFMGVGAFAAVLWANHHSTQIVPCLIASLIAGAVAGLVVGLPATRLRGPYLAGITLAVAFAFSSIALGFSWTGGDFGLNLNNRVSAPRWMVDLFSTSTPVLRPTNMWLDDIAIVTMGVAFFFMSNLFHSRTGRSMRLVRDNDVAAELVGISLPRARVVAFVVSAAYAGLGGGVTALVNGTVNPTNYDLALSITILALLVIGGIGTLWGALIGGLIFAYSSTWTGWIVNATGLNPTGNVATNLKNVVFGALLIIIMFVAPYGIAGTIKSLVGQLAVKHPRILGLSGSPH